MNNFEKLNLSVVPIGESKRPYVAWSNEETWCDWEEREEVYPHNPTGDWYVIPGCKKTYQFDGIDFGFFIIDIDNTNPEDFKKALNFVKSLGVPRTLTVRTKHNGFHLYYKTFADAMPRNCNIRNSHNLPIEIKSNVGWVAPNNRDRVVIVDEPVAMLNVIKGTPFGDLASIQEKSKPIKQKNLDPNFPIDKIPVPIVGAGHRHNKMLGTVRWLREEGCPKEKAMSWAEEFYQKNNRTPQQNEFENAWAWDSASTSVNAVEHACKPTGSVEPKKTHVDITQKEKRHTSPAVKPQSNNNDGRIYEVPGYRSPYAPPRHPLELSGLELIEAQAVFAPECDKIKLRKLYIEYANYLKEE